MLAGVVRVEVAFPIVGTTSPESLALLVLNGLPRVADSFRDPASRALFADDGTTEGGIASSFGVRELVWRPGSVLAPMLGGALMTGPDMEWVFFVGGASALTRVGAFLGIPTYDHGRAALTRW